MGIDLKLVVGGVLFILLGLIGLWFAWIVSRERDFYSTPGQKIAGFVTFGSLGLIFLGFGVSYLADGFHTDVLTMVEALATFTILVVGLVFWATYNQVQRSYRPLRTRWANHQAARQAARDRKRKGKPKRKPKPVYPIKRKNEVEHDL